MNNYSSQINRRHNNFKIKTINNMHHNNRVLFCRFNKISNRINFNNKIHHKFKIKIIPK